MIALVLLPMLLILGAAPLAGAIAGLVLKGRGYPSAGAKALQGALLAFLWPQLAIFAAVVAGWANGGPGPLLGLTAAALAIAGNTRLAQAGADPALAPLRFDPVELYGLGVVATVLGTGALVLVTAAAAETRLSQGLMLALGVVGLTATTVGLLWCGAGGALIATIRAFTAERRFDEPAHEPRSQGAGTTRIRTSTGSEASAPSQAE